MLNPEQWKNWQQFAKTLTSEQQIWLSGYIQGQYGAGGGAQVSGAAGKLEIYFATETGNSKVVAQQLLKAAKKSGWKGSVKSVSTLSPADLQAAKGPVIFVLATHGEGDPPEMAVAFFEKLQAEKEAVLTDISFITLGLGDSSYAEFCGFARKVDRQMERLGAKALLAREELDVDFASHMAGWIEKVVAALPSQAVGSAFVPMELLSDDMPLLATGKGYSRLEPLIGVVSEIVNLNDYGSNKETYHIAIDHDETSIAYAPGDAVGIILPVQEGEEAITPRLYSIASAPSVHENSIHLTVSRAWHRDEQGRKQYGICSHYLANLVVGDKVSFYFQQNLLFKLPADDQDVIMIGPGTGVAPFRSFVFERAESGATGRNWLFFGEQQAHCDFLYQQEWVDHVETDQLQRIDLAFSRDQQEKIYVQHRMRERANDLFAWLEGGAFMYLCGAKDPMSYDVDAMLLEILSDKLGSTEKAENYIAELSESGRYVKDVY